MTTGEYSVAKDKQRGGSKIRNFDNSFVSCMFAIFLFILLCVILLIIMFAVKWNKSEPKGVADDQPPTTEFPYGGYDKFGRLRESSTSEATAKTAAITRSTTRIPHSTRPPRTTPSPKVILKEEDKVKTTTPKADEDWRTKSTTKLPDRIYPEYKSNSTEVPSTTSARTVPKVEGHSTEVPTRTPARTEPMFVDHSTEVPTKTPAKTEPMFVDHSTEVPTKTSARTEPMVVGHSTEKPDSTSARTEPKMFGHSTEVPSTTSARFETKFEGASTELPTTTTTKEESEIEGKTSEIPTTTSARLEPKFVDSSTELTITTTIKNESTVESDTTEVPATTSAVMEPKLEGDTTESPTTTTTKEESRIEGKSTEVPGTTSPRTTTTSEDVMEGRLGDVTTTTTTADGTEPPTTIIIRDDDSRTTTVSEEEVKVKAETTTEASTTTLEPTTIGPPRSANETCEAVECKKLSGRMLYQMGHEHKPCDNFYMYACGELYSNPFLLPVDYTLDVKNRILNATEKMIPTTAAFHKFSVVHNSCVEMENPNEQFTHLITELLDHIGDFNANVTEEVNFTRLFSEIIKLHRPLLFDIILDVDDRDSSRYMLKMMTPMHENPFSLGGDIPASCTSDSFNLNTAYHEIKTCARETKLKNSVEALHKVLELLGRTDTSHLDAVYTFENWMKVFSELKPSEPQRRHSVLTKDFKLVTVTELNTRYPRVDWTVLLSDLLNHTVTGDTEVQLYSQEFYDELFSRFRDDRDAVEIFNTLVATFVSQLYTDLVVNPHAGSEEFCLVVTSRLMEDVAAAAYLRTFPATELRNKMAVMRSTFRQLRDALSHLLEGSDWLGEDRAALQEKLAAMTLAADGGLEVYKDLDKIDNLLSTFYPDSSYMANVEALLRRFRSNAYKSYGTDPRKSANIWSYFALPQQTYGVSIFGLNTIAIPYAMLTAPFFHPQYPKYLQLAGLGHVVAHEIAHHFDSIGMSYGATGERKALLHGSALAQYHIMETCLEEEFNTTRTLRAEDGKDVSFTLDPRLHREEQMADDIATLLLTSLFRQQNLNESEQQLPFVPFGNEKVLFLHLAQGFCSKQSLQSQTVSLFEDQHLPSMLRVNHFISQSREFSEVFDCPAGSPMNPVRRCDVFPALKPVLL